METRSLPFAITDPTTAPTYGDGALSRWCKRSLYEARDEVFVRLILKMIVVMTLAMGALFVALRFQVLPWWALGAIYLSLWGWLVPPVILMLHNTMHRPFIRRPRVLGKAVPYVMSLYFAVPTGYAEHHIGMHHYEDNMDEDLSSTMRYRRDSFLHFLVYFLRFFFLVMIELPRYLAKKRRNAMMRRALLSEWAYDAVAAVALWVDWRFGVIAFVAPYVIVRFMMMAGNWGQHAFVNTARKNDGLSNSITCINTGYNKRAFNDGYHIGHHLKMNRHWTELPKDLIDNVDTYVREGAVVFEGIDFFMVSLLLWTGRWNVLAKKFVRLDGKERSDEDVIRMLKSRVQPIAAWPAAEAPAAGAAAA
ncbi:MAG: fatty acid desaturase [Myxococcales bacterium]|jgi:fatty acid desaturase|nr:fatty acid desaturase [Myxococcales bacterium]